MQKKCKLNANFLHKQINKHNFSALFCAIKVFIPRMNPTVYQKGEWLSYWYYHKDLYAFQSNNDTKPILIKLLGTHDKKNFHIVTSVVSVYF